MGLYNTLTASIQKGKILLLTSVLGMILNNLMEFTTQRVHKCKNKRCRIWEGKSFKTPEKKFIINQNLNFNTKNVVYIIECINVWKEEYIGSTQALNTRISLHKSNIRILENRKLNVCKHLYECSNIISEWCPYIKLTTTHYFKQW